MATPVRFNGFPRECIQFLEDLRNNNNREWFEQNREVFDEQVMEPARQFVVALGGRLQKIAPYVNADPRVDQSIFRIHRDVRFGRDKRPYKTHLAMFFWEGPRKRMECSGFYFHLEPPKLMLGTGIYYFPKPLLKAYRRAVVDLERGSALVDALRHLRKAGPYHIGQLTYKRVPKGYDPDYAYAELLLFSGLTAGVEMPLRDELHSSSLVDFCFERFRDMLPLHRWLRELTEEAIG